MWKPGSMGKTLGSLFGAIFFLAFGASMGCKPGPEAVTPPESSRFPKFSGAYLGQTPPGREPQVFAPDVISTGLSELNSVFAPNGKEFYYAVDIGLDWVILFSKERDGVWSEPQIAPFTQGDSGVDMSITADGTRLLFCSNRSRSGSSEPEDNLDIWYVDRTETEVWSEPVNLAAVNSETNEFYPSLTSDGTLYFLSRRADQLGSGRVALKLAPQGGDVDVDRPAPG